MIRVVRYSLALGCSSGVEADAVDADDDDVDSPLHGVGSVVIRWLDICDGILNPNSVLLAVGFRL